MSKPYLKISASANSFFQHAVLSTIFVFKSNIYQIGPLFEKILAPILFPLVIIPDAIASLFALYHFARAENKNLGKTFELIHAPIKTALVFTAVFAGLSVIFVQGLFLTAIGSSVLYHLGLSIFHVYHWLSSEEKSSLNLLHKKDMIDNLIATGIGGIVIAGIILTMVIAPPYLGATFLAVAGITTASLLMLGTFFAIYRNFKNPPSYQQIFPSTRESSGHFVDSVPSTSSLSFEVQSSNQNSNYYHREFRSEKLTANQANNKNFLFTEIENKIDSLRNQIEKSKNRQLWSEEPKRRAKISYLNSLKNVLLEGEEGATSNPGVRNNLAHPPNKSLQSFFKKIGDVEDISLAVKHYLQLQ